MRVSLFSRFMVALALTIGCTAVAMAEGRCPPGQYPIGGQGMAGCAPIPAGETTEYRSKAKPYFIPTWGSIAVSSDRVFGMSQHHKQDVDATNAALQACRKQGGRDCQSMITFKGGCAAAVAPDNGQGQLYFQSADSGGEAMVAAMKACEAGGKGNCQFVDFTCSEPDQKWR